MLVLSSYTNMFNMKFIHMKQYFTLPNFIFLAIVHHSDKTKYFTKFSLSASNQIPHACQSYELN